ncbi:hypothetical protein K474DRAFT_102098 [Panus rudis PR-1116 ss-1]|nr:hypothetical protein K474DRAFT_102098 [Panus rudis PR-1116 ss-1]
MASIRVAILTVSDTASKDVTADKSGPTIKNILSQAGYECKYLVIVPDDEPKIRETVEAWSAEGDIDLIVTTGGTGFGVRDRTPEAISPLIQREASGLVHLLLSSSLKKTAFAALSRPVAGTINNTLVVTLPGSVKAVKESLEALLTDGLLTHAIDLIRGGSGREVHAQLNSPTSGTRTLAHSDLGTHQHGHHHHHHRHGSHSHATPRPRTAEPLSQDPTADVSARHRTSPFPLVTVKDALISILQEVEPLPPVEALVTTKLTGCVLAEDVIAPYNIPHTYTSNVDGYALRSSNPPGIYPVITTPLSSLPDRKVLYRVNTGGAVPLGADAVIMVEDTRVVTTFIDAAGKTEEKEVETLAQVDLGENIRKPGSDVKQGDLVLEKGQWISSAGGEIGTLAFVGRTKVKVFPKPVVAILSTGNELKDIHAIVPTRAETIWDTNRPSLQAALEGMGYEVIDLGIVPDDLDAHIIALRRGLESADIIITTGGTSMGTSDLLKPAIERHLNGTIHFGRVNVKPGKPTTFATIPTTGRPTDRTPIFALPGNPASALVTFYVFVVPALRRLGGLSGERCHLPRVRVKVQESMYLDARPEYHRVVIRSELDGLKAFSTGGQRSSRVSSLAGANGLVALPPYKEGGPDKVHSGDYAEAVVIGELQLKL